MIDPDGYRPNVGIVLMRPDGQVFWARRVRRDGWQFPQGGMRSDETPTEAMYRELQEETGLLPEHVELLGGAGQGVAGALDGGPGHPGELGPVVGGLLGGLGDDPVELRPQAVRRLVTGHHAQQVPAADRHGQDGRQEEADEDASDLIAAE